MMTGLESWMKRATRELSKKSATQVRAEIEEHFESAREAAMAGGMGAEEADRAALAALGEAKAANCQYRRVLLTSTEARLLGEGNWETRVVCSRVWLKWLPAAVLLASVALFLSGAQDAARVLFVGGIGMGLMFVAPLLPVYTQSRGRIFRVVKWAVLGGAFVVAFGPDARNLTWVVISCLWPVLWIEWTRASIRRKMRAEEWPKQLYL
ncbi:MAG: hypothetical protein ABI972_24825 [Acidobacteriota bacterium]